MGDKKFRITSSNYNIAYLSIINFQDVKDDTIEEIMNSAIAWEVNGNVFFASLTQETGKDTIQIQKWVEYLIEQGYAIYYPEVINGEYIQ